MKINPQGKWIPFLGFCVALAGAFISVLLILEYHGTGVSFTDAICSKGSVNACTIVAGSWFAAFRGIPLIGDIPLAVFGFIFYGFILFLFSAFLLKKNKYTADIENAEVLIIIIAAAAMLCDIALFLISVFIIKYICPLCVLTYLSTAIILILSVLSFIINRHHRAETNRISMSEYIKNNFVRFEIIVLLLFIIGIGIGFACRAVIAANNASTYEERLNLAIQQYEAAKPVVIDISKGAYIGKQDAPVNLVVFFDFTCSHCKDEINILEGLAKKYKDDIRVSFKDLPLDGDYAELDKGISGSESESCIAAAAGLCANRQGKFMDYANLLLHNYHKKKIAFTERSVLDAAGKAGLNIRDFDACLSSKAMIALLSDELKEAEKIGARSTPTLYLNGKILKGKSRKADVLDGLVRYCLQRNK